MSIFFRIITLWTGKRVHEKSEENTDLETDSSSTYLPSDLHKLTEPEFPNL